MKHLLAIVPLMMVSAYSQAELFYDVDFSSPLNTNGAEITIDESVKTPSSIDSGSIPMQKGFAGGDSNWAILNTPTCTDSEELSFDLPEGTKEIYVTYRVIAKDIINSDMLFKTHVDSDTYSGRNLQMHAGIDRWRFFNYGFSSSMNTLTDNTEHNVAIYANINTNVFTFSLDGEELLSTSFGEGNNIKSVRFLHSRWTGNATTCTDTDVGVTDIKIYEDPADLVAEFPDINIGFINHLALLGLLITGFYRKYRYKKIC